MAYKFATVDIPPDTRGRVAGENPFMETVSDMATDPAKRAKALKFEVTEGNPDLLTKSLNRIKVQLAKAGSENNVSVRKTIDTDGNKATVTFWVVDRITRTRK
jgi:hypothetical protein